VDEAELEPSSAGSGLVVIVGSRRMSHRDRGPFLGGQRLRWTGSVSIERPMSACGEMLVGDKQLRRIPTWGAKPSSR
jgi:hypothetical protein